MTDYKTKEQWEYLMSEDSPLSPLEKQKWKREYEAGRIKVVADESEKNYYERREDAGL